MDNEDNESSQKMALIEAEPEESPMVEKEKDLRDSISENSTPEGYCDLAKYLQSEKRYDEAIGWYRKAIAGGYIEAYTSLGMLLMELGRVEEADRIFKERTRAEKIDVSAWLKVIENQLTESRLDVALETLKEFFQQEPEHPDLWYLLGKTLFMKGNMKKAKKALEKAIELREESHKAWSLLGRIHSKMGKKKDALKAFKHVVDLQPENSMAWSNFGASLANLGRIEEARKALQIAADLDMDNGVAWRNLAKLAEMQGLVIPSKKTNDSKMELDKFLEE